MNVRELKDNSGVVFSPKVSTESVYLKGSTTNLDSKLSSMDTTISGKANTSSLAAVATSGSYTDLSNKPTIPTQTSQLTNNSGFLTSLPYHTHAQENNFLVYGNEFDFIPTLDGDCDIYFNYRQTGGSNGHIVNNYRFCNGTSSLTNLVAAGFYVESSRKVKENIEPTKVSGEDMINSVNVVDFNYISDKSKSPKVGFIAEDTDPIFSTRERKAMDSANCIGVMMKAIQELSAKVKTLTNKLETLTPHSSSLDS